MEDFSYPVVAATADCGFVLKDILLDLMDLGFVFGVESYFAAVFGFYEHVYFVLFGEYGLTGPAFPF